MEKVVDFLFFKGFFVVVRVVMDPDELVTWALHDRTKFRYH